MRIKHIELVLSKDEYNRLQEERLHLSRKQIISKRVKRYGMDPQSRIDVRIVRDRDYVILKQDVFEFTFSERWDRLKYYFSLHPSPSRSLLIGYNRISDDWRKLKRRLKGRSGRV